MADDDRRLSELISVRFTADQVRDIQTRARWHRITTSSMIREAAVAIRLKVPDSQAEERQLLAALRQIGQRVNHLARIANTFKAVEPIEDDLKGVLGELRSALSDFEASREREPRDE